ncbi:DUF397 domain-containing protein [Actinomadura craniellae]|uniref:DUF397 domain-containing protein n=1 Tax=Actinomadura craniellae TaxID=2231787 RepID=A0A365H2T4_9ACTN|nr:DUF397 domain-containing protein [Actinomadura craniellae]RAY13359.1 DUF397 domain-containing protein [Actinomadura craniellae]
MPETDTPADRWRKSTYSSGNGGECVELAALGSMVGIRDSKEPDGPRLSVDRPVFRHLVQQVKAGDLDL